MDQFKTSYYLDYCCYEKTLFAFFCSAKPNYLYYHTLCAIFSESISFFLSINYLR